MKNVDRFKEDYGKITKDSSVEELLHDVRERQLRQDELIRKTDERVGCMFAIMVILLILFATPFLVTRFFY